MRWWTRFLQSCWWTSYICYVSIIFCCLKTNYVNFRGQSLIGSYTCLNLKSRFITTNLVFKIFVQNYWYQISYSCNKYLLYVHGMISVLQQQNTYLDISKILSKIDNKLIWILRDIWHWLFKPLPDQFRFPIL